MGCFVVGMCSGSRICGSYSLMLMSARPATSRDGKWASGWWDNASQEAWSHNVDWRGRSLGFSRNPKTKKPYGPLPKETPVLGSHVPAPPEVPQYLSLRDVGSFSGFRALDT